MHWYFWGRQNAMWAPTSFFWNVVQDLFKHPSAVARLNLYTHGARIEIKKSQWVYLSGQVCKIIVNLRVQKCRISFGLYSLCLRDAHSSIVKFHLPLRFYTHRTCILSLFGSSARKRKDMDKTVGEISGTGSDCGLSKGTLCEPGEVTSLLPAKEGNREEQN